MVVKYVVPFLDSVLKPDNDQKQALKKMFAADLASGLIEGQDKCPY